MKKEIICQDSRPPHLHPLPRIQGRGGEWEDFTLTSSLKFPINLYRY